MDYYQVNIDGKVLRATGKAGKKHAGICLVSAWVQSQRLVLAQRKVEGKSNEKKAIPDLIDSLDLQGAVVSIDAIGCSEKIAKSIVDKGGEYLLSLKKNQKNIYEQVSEYMLKGKESLDTDEWVDFGSGRIEHRTAYVCDRLELLDDVASWPAIKSIVMIEASREKDGKVQQETRFYVSSLAAKAPTFNQLVRSHWGIENNLHWMLDVVFREDQSRTRKGNTPENVATLRKTALQLLNQASDKESIKSRRKMAGWDDKYLLKLLQNLRF
jgi:predicted transposase YbfD/YdcC